MLILNLQISCIEISIRLTRFIIKFFLFLNDCISSWKMSYMSTANLDHTHPSLPLQHLLPRTLFLIPSVNVCVIMFSFCLSKKSLILFLCVCLCVMDNMIKSIISNTLFASYFPKPAVITYFQAPCTFIDNQLKQGVLPLKCFLFCLFVPLLIC